MDKPKVQRHQKAARPLGDVDAPESRRRRARVRRVHERDSPSSDSEFGLLQHWATWGVDRVDPSGQVLVPARWLDIGLLWLGCTPASTPPSGQAEKKFSRSQAERL